MQAAPMRPHPGVLLGLVAVLFVACPQPPDDLPDAGQPDSGVPTDAGRPDAGKPDSGTPDAGRPDAGHADSGIPDAGQPDAGTPDAGKPDSGLPDSGTVDAGKPDSGTVDAGKPDSGTVDAGPTCQSCPLNLFQPPTAIGTVAYSEVIETSGIAASRANPGIFYIHNDSGDSARFFAINAQGSIRGEFWLTGVTAVDWEDMDIGPCPTGTCLYIGDIGDNNAVRVTKFIYRVKEPVVSATSSAGVVMLQSERLDFNYPSGLKHNSETLLVHPITGAMYTVTKVAAGNPSSVYKFPNNPWSLLQPVTLSFVTQLSIPGPMDDRLTAGAIDPCGSRVLLRTYDKLYLGTVPAGAASFDALFSAPFVTVPVANEPKGEAVAWLPSGMGYVTISENGGQAQTYLNQVSCQ